MVIIPPRRHPARILNAATAAMRERSRRALLDAVVDAASVDVTRDFDDVVRGDVHSVVRWQFNHYEKAGDLVVRGILEEGP